MSVTFQVPPNWPTPPSGFIPPAGWRPDPAWGPAPPGWVFYTDNGMPITPPAGSWQQPGMPQPGAQQPPYQPSARGYEPPEIGFGQHEPPKKSKLGLVIGIITGALVIVVGLSVVVFFLFIDKGPTLNTTQFNSMFPKNDSFMGRTIQGHITKVGTSNSSDSCWNAMSKGVTSADDSLGVMSSSRSLMLAAGRFKDREQAEKIYSEGKSACEVKAQGVVNKAQWFSITTENRNQNVAVQYGNVAVVVFAGPNTSDPSDVAKAVRAEIDKAANL